jgi:hypothetical protein
MWHENIWGVRRSWEAQITDQAPCERIAWRSTGGPQTIGVVTLHRLSDRLTRIFITLDFQPKGLFEKTASGTRISRRALKSDLMRFKAFIELRDEATGEWGARIEDGEVVEEDGRQDGDEDFEHDDEPRASEEHDDYEDEDEDDEPRASEEDDEEEYEDEDVEDEAEPVKGRGNGRGRFDRDAEDTQVDDEPEEAPPPRRRRRSATASTGRDAR